MRHRRACPKLRAQSSAFPAPETKNITSRAALIIGNVNVTRSTGGGNTPGGLQVTHSFRFLKRRLAGKQRCGMAIVSQTEQIQIELRKPARRWRSGICRAAIEKIAQHRFVIAPHACAGLRDVGRNGENI